MITETAIESAEQSVKRFVGNVEAKARQEPARTATTALLVGLALNILPTRFLVASATAITLTILRPALLTLGAFKALEFITQQSHNKQNP